MKLRNRISLMFASAIILLASFPQTLAAVNDDVFPSPEGNITFQPNAIPGLEANCVEEFFRFEWLENHFDLKLYIHHAGNNLSLLDFMGETKGDATWTPLENKVSDSMFDFGYLIKYIPEEILDNVDYLIWKVENASFKVSEIRLDEIEVFDNRLGRYNITRFHLPNNLVLSYEDLYLSNFTVSHPNKLETIVKGVEGKEVWTLDPIIYSSPTITVTGYTEATPANFNDLYVADKSNNLTLLANTAAQQNLNLTTILSPTDNVTIPIVLNITDLTLETADSIATITGTLDAGNLTSIQTKNDGNSYNVSEVSGSPGFNVEINFTGVSTFEKVFINEWYDGNIGHTAYLQFYNYTSTSWVNILQIVDAMGFHESTATILDYTHFVSSGTVYTRAYHSTSGNTNHDWHLDYIELFEDGTCNVTGTIYNDTIATESIDFPSNGYFETVNYWKNISQSGIDASGSFNISIFQEQWGVVWKTSDMQFQIDSKLQIGDGVTTTWFKDINVQVAFTTTTEFLIYVQQQGRFQLGNLEDSTNKVTSSGCHLLFDLAGGPDDVAYYAVANSITKFYGCILQSQSHQSSVYVFHGTAYAYLYNTLFVGLTWRMFLPHIDMIRFTQTAQSLGSGNGLRDAVSADANFSDIMIQGNQYALYGETGTIRNLVARNNTYVIYLWHASFSDAFLINPDVDIWNVRLIDNYVNEVYRQYEFDLTVTYPNGTAIENANVTINYEGQETGQIGSWLTPSNGSIPTQTLSRSFYNQTGGNTEYAYYPYNITITAEGYDTYINKWTPSEKTTWEIALTPQTGFAAGTIFGGILAFLILLVLGLAYFKKKS